jgi:hypothetical protein
MAQPRWVLAFVLLAGVFLRAGYAPVAVLDSWSDWKYGQWIWENRRIPTHEEFSPDSDRSIQLRDGSWLAEVIYYLVVSRSGLEGVALLHGLLETAKAALYLWAVRRATGSLGTALVVTALMEALCWPYFDAIRTRVAAEVCWAALMLACSRSVPSRADVVAAPALVALWANLSATFGFGFLLLGGLLVGRLFQEMRARRGLAAATRDPAMRRLALMLGLSVVAAWCNPYGAQHVWDAFGQQGLVVIDMRQWPKLVPVHLWESRVVTASVVGVLVLLRLSPRQFTTAELLLTATFGIAAWWDKRAAPWWLMLAPWLLAPHLDALGRLLTHMPEASARAALGRALGLWATPRSRFGMVCALSATAALLVLLSPAARWAAGRPLSAERRVGPMVPYDLAAPLADRPAGAPPRHVFSEPFWWGDYLLWALPRDDRVFWYSRPEGFMRQRSGTVPGVDRSPEEWRALIERYGFDTLVVAADLSDNLTTYLARAPGEWEVLADNTAPDNPGGGPASRGILVVRRARP